MYAIETAKMSSKGQLVVPETFRKRYGWQPGTTLLMIGANDGVLLQTLPVPDESEVEENLIAAHAVASSVNRRIQDACQSLDRLSGLGISLPVDIERGDKRRKLAERHHA